MRFAFVTDELNREDPRDAIETAIEWGVREFEIRNAFGVRFPKQDNAGLEKLLAMQSEYGISYTAVSPGFFKCHLDDSESIAYALGPGFDRCVEFMKSAKCNLLILFGFELATGTDEEAIEQLGRMADQLDAHGMRGAVENETHCRFNTPERIAELLARIDRPNLGANWDYANFQEYAPDAFPAGYERVKPRILNVHAKDVILAETGNRWAPVGDGVCAWQDQLRALVQDGIVASVTIENHCGPLKEVGKRNLETLRGYLGTR